MRRHCLLAAISVAAALLFLPGCFNTLTEPVRNNPADPDNPTTSSDIPPRPSGLAAVVSDRNVILTWSVSDTTHVDHYNVYRWEAVAGEDEDYELYETPEARRLVDAAVQNGQEYLYKVSGVNALGLEGKRSAPRRVTPRIYSLAIDQGRPKTGSRTVTLSLSASGSAQLMRISNSSGMSGASWIPYTSSYSWQLTSGDGEKTVYAMYRDVMDNESDVVSDAIELDTRATILSVTQDSGGEILYAGDVIHFTLDSGEPYGMAAVDIGSDITNILLFDDGSGGDREADDGVYERDYVIGHYVDVIAASVTGHFLDEVDNDAETELANGTVTIHDPPTAVTMQTPTPLSERRIALSWSRNTDPDFGSYKLYRSYVPGVGSSTARVLISEGLAASQTDFTDTDLEPDSTYYYAVYVVDDIGLTAISNEVPGTTLANTPPAPVTMYAPWAPDSTSLIVSWSQSDEGDFRQYELVGWEQDPPNPPDTAGKRVIARFDQPEDTFYTHSSLIESLVYWYEVTVVDSFGATATSGSVSGSPRPARE
ncbi:MAG: hypothetical protein ABIG03_04980 [Candidatus Eisenbacteria bacterium]